MNNFNYRVASTNELNLIWDKDIANNFGDSRWIVWKSEFIENNNTGKCKTFIVFDDKEPIGQGTLLFSPQCNGIRGRVELADGIKTVCLGALRIEKQYEGQGHISKLVKMMEQYAKDKGYKIITIGVEPKETRNLAIYLHWGYDTFIKSEMEDNELILYYSKYL